MGNLMPRQDGKYSYQYPTVYPRCQGVPHLLPENIESLFSRSKAFCKIDGLAVHQNERLDNQKAIKMTLKHSKTRLYPYYHILYPSY